MEYKYQWDVTEPPGYNPLISTTKARRKRRAARRRVVRRTEGTRYPFKMDELVLQNRITIEQRDKFMAMLTSTDREIEQLAVSMLRELNGYK